MACCDQAWIGSDVSLAHVSEERSSLQSASSLLSLLFSSISSRALKQRVILHSLVSLLCHFILFLHLPPVQGFLTFLTDHLLLLLPFPLLVLLHCLSGKRSVMPSVCTLDTSCLCIRSKADRSR
jgi:hypothetical protein